MTHHQNLKLNTDQLALIKRVRELTQLLSNTARTLHSIYRAYDTMCVSMSGQLKIYETDDVVKKWETDYLTTRSHCETLLLEIQLTLKETKDQGVGIDVGKRKL